MCPYFDEKYKQCKIYKTQQSAYNEKAYCHECEKPYTQCPNYLEMKRVYNGNPPPPYKF